jgi:hypothetical protein
MHTERLDRAGSTTSVLCAIHCALSPLVLPLLPLTASRLIGPTLEWSFVALALVLGISSLTHSYRAIHRDGRAIMLFGLGFAALMAVRVVEPEGPIEPVMVFCAATLIVSAHLLNLRMGRSATGCGCPCGDD